MGKILAYLHGLFFWTLVILIFFVYVPVLWLMSLGKAKPELVFLQGANNFSRFMLWVAGVRVKVSGRENVPKQDGYIVVANHQSAFDIFLLLACLPPKFYFTMKEELFRVPVFSWFAKKAGYISIARTNALAASRALQRTIGILQAGGNILIFPEGTRSYGPQLGNFKRGVAEMILLAKAPVLPVVLDGSYKILDRQVLMIRPAEVKITFLPIRTLSREDLDPAQNSSQALQFWVNELRQEFVRVIAN